MKIEGIEDKSDGEETGQISLMLPRVTEAKCRASSVDMTYTPADVEVYRDGGFSV